MSKYRCEYIYLQENYAMQISWSLLQWNTQAQVYWYLKHNKNESQHMLTYSSCWLAYFYMECMEAFGSVKDSWIAEMQVNTCKITL